MDGLNVNVLIRHKKITKIKPLEAVIFVLFSKNLLDSLNMLKDNR